MNMQLCVATMDVVSSVVFPGNVGSLVLCLDSPRYCRVRTNTQIDNLGVVGSYQWLYERSGDADILAYIHDDVQMFEDGWDARVLAEFADPAVGIVGFGGALRHGSPDLYRAPYAVNQLARAGYRSNTRDWFNHGKLLTGACNAAVHDGFALICRREFLDRVGGWSQIQGNADFLCYDYAICALARRHGYKIRVVGVDCMHYGGGTSVAVGVRQDDYDRSHRWFYEEFTDVIPCEVEP